MSSIKNEYGHINGYYGKKTVLHDKAQHAFIWGKDTDIRRRIGLKCWKKVLNEKLNKLPKELMIVQW